ncbi:MAG: hypothetical protein V7K97_15685 [Nostoc sp.]|uniref:hypothetical protein n=1 Tax=Nostoc sp. TaxID=1180 RepID=UPI002FF595A1
MLLCVSQRLWQSHSSCLILQVSRIRAIAPDVDSTVQISDRELPPCYPHRELVRSLMLQ